ncbi:MAG: hypothetical protein AB1758_35335 [Candidatus Eremiobacterota bacterium]
MNQRLSTAILALTLWGAPAALAGEEPTDPAYAQAVQRTAAMTSDAGARSLALKYGLNILNVTWEDTGRYKGSSVGPNISDMTLQVQTKTARGDYALTCLPVIRYPNFEDKSADLDPDRFFLLVGNEKGGKLRKVSLRQFLGDMRAYMHQPDSWKGERTSLLADRDSHVLVSAQACFLPVPPRGECQFNPVLFNYQSYAGDPAVLTILATREGTSLTVIDNQRDGFDAGRTWGQRLFFNQNGERASLTGKRLSDFLADHRDSNVRTPEAAGAQGLNMVLLVQVPLKQKNPMRPGLYSLCDDACAAAPVKSARGMEDAVIGHGKVEGPFTEVAGLDIERDPRFPIRVTVQFYKATDDGQIGADEMAAVAAQIDRVYTQADYVGSLVTGGETGRPTEWTADQGESKTEPAGWWEAFWERHQDNTGQTREDAYRMLRKLLGLPRET